METATRKKLAATAAALGAAGGFLYFLVKTITDQSPHAAATQTTTPVAAAKPASASSVAASTVSTVIDEVDSKTIVTECNALRFSKHADSLPQAERDALNKRGLLWSFAVSLDSDSDISTHVNQAIEKIDAGSTSDYHARIKTCGDYKIETAIHIPGMEQAPLDQVAATAATCQGLFQGLITQQQVANDGISTSLTQAYELAATNAGLIIDIAQGGNGTRTLLPSALPSVDVTLPLCLKAFGSDQKKVDFNF